MKNFILFLLLIISNISYSQKITRGPDIGEIYFLGPTYSGKGLYYSDDFGETATFVDGSMNYISIAADKTKGGIYCVTLPTALYYSDNFGYLNTWEFKFYNDYLSDKIVSGVIEGHIFSDCWMHSENYGSNFIVHSLNGWFGSLINVAIDITNENIGYALVYKIVVPDTIYLFRTTDKFENVNVINKFNLHNGIIIQLISGILEGELFSYNQNTNCLGLSSDYAENFELIDCFNFKDQYYFDMTGGRQTGELYILYSFVNMLWQNAHVYIYHSLDYGKTFEVFHPFAKGNEPVLANFSTDTTEGEMPFTVEFCNFSIGDIQQYEWDFDNNSSVDSYEESPLWTFQDTGYYSVRLTITGTDSSNSFLKEDYIHVVKTTGINETSHPEFDCYPNPFDNYIIFDFVHDHYARKISIFDILGNQMTTILKQSGTGKVFWDGTDKNGVRGKPGIYFVKIEGNAIFKKILLTW